MKIAYVFDAVYPHVKGGVEKRIWELSIRLAAQGNDVHIFGMKYWAGDDVILREGVRLHGVCKPIDLYNSSGRRSIRQVLYFSVALPLKLMREGFDVVDCQASPYFPALVCRLYCSLKGARLILTWHEVWGKYWGQYLGLFGCFGATIERICAKLTLNNIAVSKATARDLEAIGGKSPLVVPNGVDLEYFGSIDASKSHSDIIFIGRLIRDKNVELLLEACAILRNKFPKVQIVIIGDGPERAALEKKSANLGLDTNVHFRGFLSSYDQVAALLKSSKVFAFPSSREGFGIVVLEAMTCGLPVVTVRHEKNAAADLVRDGENGFVVGLNADELAASIVKLLADDALRGKMSSKAIEKSAELDWGKIASQLQSHYLAVAGSKLR
jgi:glycosyltransferase involved in cell wall biosynthesis